MPKLYVMCGISGSGKSTYAKSIQSSAQNRTIIISTDELRAMLYGDASDQTDPELIFNMAYSMIQMLLERNYDVIFDAMNLKIVVNMRVTYLKLLIICMIFCFIVLMIEFFGIMLKVGVRRNG